MDLHCAKRAVFESADFLRCSTERTPDAIVRRVNAILAALDGCCRRRDALQRLCGSREGEEGGERRRRRRGENHECPGKGDDAPLLTPTPTPTPPTEAVAVAVAENITLSSRLALDLLHLGHQFSIAMDRAMRRAEDLGVPLKEPNHRFCLVLARLEERTALLEDFLSDVELEACVLFLRENLLLCHHHLNQFSNEGVQEFT